MNTTTEYDANFTAGGIFFNEYILLKDLILNDNFISLIKSEEEKNNYIAITTKSARKRIISEIKRRYNNAPEGFWENFYIWQTKEQKLALFYLVLKTYPLILDIHIEVALKKFKIGSELDAFDVSMRFDEIASFNEKVSTWTDATFEKLNSQYRTALKDVGLLNNKVLTRPSNIDSSFWDYFIQLNETWFLEACFINI